MPRSRWRWRATQVLLHEPARRGALSGVHWPALVPATWSRRRRHRRRRSACRPVAPPGRRRQEATVVRRAQRYSPVVRSLGSDGRRAISVRSSAHARRQGDNANVGVWARATAAYAWLESFLTAERFRGARARGGTARGPPLRAPPICSLNFVVVGLLGDGVAASTRISTRRRRGSASTCAHAGSISRRRSSATGVDLWGRLPPAAHHNSGCSRRAPLGSADRRCGRARSRGSPRATPRRPGSRQPHSGAASTSFRVS